MTKWREKLGTLDCVARQRNRIMPIFVIAPDKFKGSLDAHAVAQAMARGLQRVYPEAEIRLCPMADGGDGTLDAILARGGTRHTLPVAGADGGVRPAPYGLLGESSDATAVIEAASVVGITDHDGMAVPVERRTTTGLGELVRELMDRGIRRFMIGLGGSSTNDGGAGLLGALGVRLTAADGGAIAPTPEGLERLARVDVEALDSRLRECEITVLSDVDNPLCGARGATAIFGPQKGVAPGAIERLDERLARLGRLAERAFGREVAQLPGAGAAGGLGFALQLLGARMRPGAEVVAELVGLDTALVGADWLLTGEGRSDVQTLGGKAPWIAAQHARAASVPATLLSGGIDSSALPRLGGVFAGCFALPDAPLTLAEAMERAEALLEARAEQLALLWRASRSGHRHT